MFRYQTPSQETTEHDCRDFLPYRNGGYGSTGYEDLTVGLCPSCDRAWVSVPCYESYGPVSLWRPVFWCTRPSIKRRAKALQNRKEIV